MDGRVQINSRTNNQMCPSRGVGQGLEDTECRCSTSPWGGLPWEIFPCEFPQLASCPFSLYAWRLLPSSLLGEKKQNTDTRLWPCCPFPILFIFCLFFFPTKLQFYLLHCLYARDHQQTCSFRLPRHLCLFQGHFSIFISFHDFAVSIMLISPLENSSLNISMKLFLREQ